MPKLLQRPHAGLKNRSWRKLLVLGGILLLLVALRQGTLWYQGAKQPHNALEQELVRRGGFTPGDCEIVAVIDGRTLLVRQSQSISSTPGPASETPADKSANGNGDSYQSVTGRLRLIGIPASAAKDEKAMELLKELTTEKKGRLTLDQRRIDRDGSLIGYVDVDGESLAGALLSRGLCKYEAYPGDSAKEGKLLQQAMKDAQQKKEGIWSK